MGVEPTYSYDPLTRDTLSRTAPWPIYLWQ